VENGELVADGEGDDLDLLRALCHVAWESGVTKVAGAAEARLGLS
jgi:glycerol 3-phosphatase-2